jgi:hypothetical protein
MNKNKTDMDSEQDGGSDSMPSSPMRPARLSIKSTGSKESTKISREVFKKQLFTRYKEMRQDLLFKKRGFSMNKDAEVTL